MLHAAGLGGELDALAVSGMAAFLAAIAIIVKMTGNLALLPTVMLAAALALPLSRLLRARSICGAALHPQPARSFSQLRIADVLRPAPPCVPTETTMGALREAYLASRWQNHLRRRWRGSLRRRDVDPCVGRPSAPGLGGDGQPLGYAAKTDMLLLLGEGLAA